MGTSVCDHYSRASWQIDTLQLCLPEGYCVATELILLIGVQAAAKTTFYRRRLADSYIHFSMDLLRTTSHPARRQAQLIEQALQERLSVVVDNTSPTAEVRAPLIAPGKQRSCAIIGYYFPPDVASALKRNAGRRSRARVPPAAIYATRKKLQPPPHAEGFDALYSVRNDEACAFQVWPSPEEAMDA
jgi:predicted kinase